MNVVSLLDRAGRQFGDRGAVARGTEALTSYAVLRQRVARAAAGLVERGVQPGDRVAVVMTNSVTYLETLYAIWWAGAVAVPINAKLHADEIGYVFGHAEVRLCIASDDRWPAVQAAARTATETAGPSEGSAGPIPVVIGDPLEAGGLLAADPVPMTPRDPEALAWLFYTSGTTGRPKGAMLTHRNLLAMTWAFLADVDDVGADDVLLHAAPISHGSGLYNFVHLARGAAQVVPASGTFDPEEIAAVVDHHRGVRMFAAPTMVTRLRIPALHRPRGLRSIVYGGGPMLVEDSLAALEHFGPRMIQIYGQGESPMTITVLPRVDHAGDGGPQHRQRLGSVGYPFAGLGVSTVDGADQAVAPGATGEVVVRGDTVMAGYWRDDEATSETLRGGWLHTGDLGRFDERGYLTLCGRSKEVIISGGSNIYPKEVEDVLVRHRAVREVAVVGQPDPHWGERVVAFVVLDPAAGVSQPGGPVPDALAAELEALCLGALARFKRPRRYESVAQLPKNHYGKVLKRALRRSKPGF